MLFSASRRVLKEAGDTEQSVFEIDDTRKYKTRLIILRALIQNNTDALQHHAKHPFFFVKRGRRRFPLKITILYLYAPFF